MNVGSPAEPAEHPTAARLRLAGITKAVVIDDAYDPPTLDAHRDAIHGFWDRVERDPELMKELRGLSPGVAVESDLDDGLLRRLWEERDALPKLGPLVKRDLFIAKLGDVNILQRLRDHLSGVNVETVTVGSEQDLPMEPVKLIFIDYYLGPEVSDSVNAATAKARAIYDNAATDADKPFIVLMSSKPDADAAKDAFREASRLLGGLFAYVSKEDLQDKEKLYFHLATWAFGMPTRHEIQHFVEALSAGLKTASDDFTRRVQALGFEDYVNIQWLSLQQEGQPLGDYMLWLYKSLLAYLLHNTPGVLAQQKKLDAMGFDQFAPSQAPSPQLAEIYRYALTEPGVEEVGPHPRAPAGNQDPFLSLGDLFFKDQGADVLMIINAACDLAYAPGTKRSFPRELTILLVRGQLQRYEEIQTSGSSLRTELFKHDGKAYRILWHDDRVIAKGYGEVKEWLRQEGYSRKARLALPGALQVQQGFATHLIRIGMPTRPPLFRYADVEVYFEGADGNYCLLGRAIDDGASIVRRKKKDQDRDEDLFVLTTSCAVRIVRELDPIIEGYEGQRAALNPDSPAESGKAKGLQGWLAKLEQLKQLSEHWVEIVQTPCLLPLDGSKKCEVNKELLWVYRDRTFEGKYREGPPIVLNIRSKRDPVALAAHDAQPHEVEASNA